jgi:hypothetical protein
MAILARPVAHISRGPQLRDSGRCGAFANPLSARHPDRGRAEQGASESKDLLLRPAVIPITALESNLSHTQKRRATSRTRVIQILTARK